MKKFNIILCSICGLQQRATPSGMTCINGHGGAPGLNKIIYAFKPMQNYDLEIAILNLVEALVEGKGWLRDYADAVVRDAIDRKTHE